MYREGVCAVFSEREASSLAPATSWSQGDMCRFAWLDFHGISRRWFRAAGGVLSPRGSRRGALLHRVSSHRDVTPSELWGARALGSRRDKAVDEFVEFVLCSLCGRTRRGKSVIAGFRASRWSVEEVNFVAPRATVAIQASQKVLAQLLTLTRHGTEEPQHRYASALRLRRTVPYRRDDETDADDARCHLLGFVCERDVSGRPTVSFCSAGKTATTANVRDC